MSFDLYFVEREGGASRDKVMNRPKEAHDPTPALTDEDAATWAKIVVAVSDLLDSTETHADESCYELDHPATGIQISYFASELVLTIPYWYDGDEAVAMEQQLREVVAAIERSSGLVAYDLQADEEFLATDTGSTAATFDHISARLAEHVARPAPSSPEAPVKQPWWRRLLGGD